MVRRVTGPGAVQRYRMAWIAHHRDPDEAAVADDPAGRVEIDPARPRQIDLGPGVGVSAAVIPVVAAIRQMQIAGDKARRHSQRAHGLDHEHSEVATASTSDPESERRVLNSLLVPGHMGEGL